MPSRVPSRARHLVGGAVLVLLSGLVSACDAGNAEPAAGPGETRTIVASDGTTTVIDSTGDPVKPKVTVNVKKKAADVSVSKLVTVSTSAGSLESVKLTSDLGELTGEISSDGATWTAGDRLEPGITYQLLAVADNDGQTAKLKRRFTTTALASTQQIFPSMAPLDGETVGIGMPVLVTFDHPVENKAEFEKHMTVTATPSQVGSWYWLSDTEVHWRPKKYWKAHSSVHVDLDVNGLDAGNGYFGQEDRQIDFTIGDAHIYKVNAKTHQMKVFSNGKLLRTLPTTTGKPGHETRSGVKVIVEKFESKTMSSETVGVPLGSADSYYIEGVKWAMRLTYSGEFIHAAPWSVGSQGHANVSHGCTGLSTENAGWLYAMSLRGDVVETVGTGRPMEFGNGYGDWNASFKDYQEGSALT